MKTLTFYLFALLTLAACSEQDPAPVKTAVYTFTVTAPDNAKFQAVVTWDAGGIKYRDPVDAWAYASSFEAKPGTVFTITVASTLPALRLSFLDEREQVVKETTIEPNRSYTFDNNLNQ